MNDYMLKNLNVLLDTINTMVIEGGVYLDEQTSVSLEIVSSWCNEETEKRQLERE